jgi:hypothetical protein
LYIIDAYGAQKFYVDLSSYERNRLKFTSKEISPVTGIRKMLVTCNSVHESEQKQVLVEIWFGKERNPAFSQHLKPHSDVKLTPHNFWILKDPDEEQLLRDRSEDVLLMDQVDLGL